MKRNTLSAALRILLAGLLMAGGVASAQQQAAPPASITPPGSITDTTFPNRLAETVMGRRIAPPEDPPAQPRPGRRPVLVGSPYPLFAYPWLPAPPVLLWNAPSLTQNVVVVSSPAAPAAQPQPPAPRIEVFQTPASAAPAADGNAVSGSPATAQARLWLVFRDGNVYPAKGYWADGATIHWIGLDDTRRAAKTTDIDRETTLRLNEENGSPIRLPHLR